MAKPNYQFEKRQRDLEKKRKQEEKRQRKLSEKKTEDGEAVAAGGDEPATPASADPDAAA